MNLQNTSPRQPRILPTSRRRFMNRLLASGTFVGLAATLPLNALAQERKGGGAIQLNAATLPETTRRELKTNTRSAFQAHLSDYFQTTDGFGKPMSLLLLAINDLPTPPSFPSKQKETEWREMSFSLIFRGSLALPLRQNTYKLKHPVLGELQIFLVPVGKVNPNAAGRDYEAVFNRTTE